MYWDEKGVGYFLDPVPDSEADTRQWKRFRKYDEKNPQIWDAFKVITQRAIEKGHNKMGASFVINIIRWEMPEISTKDIYKVNNDFYPYYARKYMKENPNQRNVFEVRKLRAI